MANSKLYIIGTPLGNRNDITLRALEHLREVAYFFVEDSREFRKLLDLHGIDAKNKTIFSYANHNMKEATEKALELLLSGINLGLCSDRGMPGISDPGAMLVASARVIGVKIVPIPGPSSVTTLMSCSGFSADRFIFLGFLPLENKARQKYFDLISNSGLPCCVFESPRRIRATVKELKKVFPKGEICLGREMTKLYETFEWFHLCDVDTESLSELGEYAFVFFPGETTPDAVAWHKEVDLRLAADKPWSKEVAERHGVPASVIYNSLQLKKAAIKQR